MVSRMSVGGILGESWGLYTRFFKRFFVIAIIVYLIVNLLNALVATLFGHGVGISLLLALTSMVVSLVGTFWLEGALVFAVDDVRDGKIDSGVGEIFERVRPYLWTLILAGILAGLGIAVGLVLFIVPGLILLTWWCLIVPVIVLEGKQVGESFSRSRELVRGHAWTVFGVVVVTAILSAIASGIIQAIFSFLGAFLRYWIGGAIASAVVGPFFAIALTLMYFTLRGLGEGAATPALAPAPAAPAEPAAPADPPTAG
jgi:ABC-type multidrug transport system fused ATPase/permease subunit